MRDYEDDGHDSESGLYRADDFDGVKTVHVYQSKQDADVWNDWINRTVDTDADPGDLAYHIATYVPKGASKRKIVRQLKGRRVVDECGGLYFLHAAGIEVVGGEWDHIIPFGLSPEGLEQEPTPPPSLEDLPPYPSLTLLIARPEIGKTRYAMTIAQAWAAGVAPWPDAEKLPGGPVLFLSAEDQARAIRRTMEQLAKAATPTRKDWLKHCRVVARDRNLSESERAVLRLDADGLKMLRSIGKKFELIILDSLSTLKPPDCEESSNDDMSALLRQLQEIAEETEVHIILIHHEGHVGGRRARGASSIGAIARATWRLERVLGHLRQRRLRISGNDVSTRDVLFEVAPPEAEPSDILYFRPCEPSQAIAIDSVLEIGEEISIHKLASKLGPTGSKPTGRQRQLATKLCEKWAREGRVELSAGPRNTSLVKRIR